MTKARTNALRAFAIGLTVFAASCLGPNNATGRLGQWNNQIDGKWGNEAAFVLLLPVYAIFSIGDVLIFNSVQWWTGNNPIEAPDQPGPTL